MNHTKYNKSSRRKVASIKAGNILSAASLSQLTTSLIQYARKWWATGILHRFVIIIIALLIIWVGSMYGIAEGYILSNRNKPVTLGATFIADYASFLGVDPKDTLHAVIFDLGVKELRLVSYWDDIEKSPGRYDFSNLDWQMKMAEQAHVKVSLAIGLRQPRWPECHMPTWASTEPKTVWQPQLESFITHVINRYKSSPALASYQLENEYFLKVFGICPDFSRDRLLEEFNMAKQIDPTHKIIVSRSNNAIGFPIGQPQPDEYGVSVYKRVWDKTLTKRYFEYPFPAWFYGFLAGGGKILTGKDLVIHELQAEAWTPDGYSIKDAPVAELYKSMNPARLHDRFAYAEGTGIKNIDLWGVEWWYQMKVKRNQPGLWDAAKTEYTKVGQSD